MIAKLGEYGSTRDAGVVIYGGIAIGLLLVGLAIALVVWNVKKKRK